MANRGRQPHQIAKMSFILHVENTLFRPYSENDFLAALKVQRIVRNPGLGEFEAMPPE